MNLESYFLAVLSLGTILLWGILTLFQPGKKVHSSDTSIAQPIRRWPSGLILATVVILAVGACCWWANRGHSGYVASTHFSVRTKGQPTFLDLGNAFPNQDLTVVIWGSDRPAFPQSPENFYLHKVIRVRGRIIHFRGRPEIVVTSPTQVSVQQ